MIVVDAMIVELVTADPDDVTVVTSDRGLIDRLPAGVAVEGAKAFRHHVGW